MTFLMRNLRCCLLRGLCKIIHYGELIPILMQTLCIVQDAQSTAIQDLPKAVP